MTRWPGAAQLLDVEVDHLAWLLPLVADDGRLGIEHGKAAKAQPPQDRADGRARHAKPGGNLRPGEALAAELPDLGQPFGELERS